MSERLTDQQLQILWEQWQPAAVEIQTLRARVAKLEAALAAAQQLIRDLGSPQAADRLGSEFGLKDEPQ